MSLGVFIPLAVLLILGALGVVLNRNPVRSALCLVGTLFVLAVVYVLLDAYLVAMLQVLVYAGAIMVLFLFVIMLLNLQEEPRERARRAMRMVAAAAAACWAFLIVVAVGSSALQGSGAPAAGFGSASAISERLFTRFLLPFEITSLLLLIAIVGAVVLAKRNPL